MIENNLDYKGLFFLIAPVGMLLFLEFFYLELKSDDFVNSNNVITKNIGESIVGGRLFFQNLNICNRLDLCDSIVRLLRFFVKHPSGNSAFTGATLGAGFWLRHCSYCCRAANR